MMPDGDTAAHLRKQVGGLFFNALCVQEVTESRAGFDPSTRKARARVNAV